MDAGPELILEAFSHFFARHKHPDNGKKGFRPCFVRGNEQREMCGPLPAVSALARHSNESNHRIIESNDAKMTSTKQGCSAKNRSQIHVFYY